jgi:hypothetical protein
MAAKPKAKLSIATHSKASPPARTGRRQVAFFIDPAAKRQLDIIALDENETLQSLMLQAVNLLFKARKKPELAA